ncbi:MAG: hypothetical protein CSA70_11120 [Rhodobacterales bacterium]|nr:MAG: hypothetical protein CSA70_11120 [Rhodobacterales bacterium]
MILRALTLAGGLAGAAGLSQFPEYSQQYIQRLAGAVDELERLIARFDADAAGLEMSRTQALVDLAGGSSMGKAQAQSVSDSITRHDRLAADPAMLKSAGPFMRAYNARRFTDGEIARRVWDDFKPALPLTFEGAVFGGTGFLGGLLAVSLIIGVIRLPFRRKSSA